jgi:DNA-binding LacI/PurR family transcriptional regulator
MIERLKTASQKGGVSKIFGSSYQRKLSKVFQRSVKPRRLSSRDNRSHKATSRDVAQLAGVSLSAVSRAYTPGRSVSREAREKIQKAADRLGYKPNAIARMLITRRRDIIGCVVGDLTNFFLSSVLDRLTLELQNRSFLPLLFRVQGTEDLDKVLPAILEYQVGAVVLTRFAPSRVATELCQKAGVPFIIMNLEVGRADNTIRISCDHEAGGRLAASALIADGHQRIAYIAGIPGLSNNEDRKRGFLSRLADDGRMAWTVGEGGRTYEAGYAAGAKMLGTSQRPDAIFCNNDMLAIGALDAARQLYGLRVPDDVAILGFDDVPIASWPAYNLSTIRQPVESMVAATTSLIESLPRSAAQENSVHLFPAELVRRGTTRGENSAAKQRISTVSPIPLRSE